MSTKSTAGTTNEIQLKEHPGKHHKYNSVAEKLQIDDINQALDSLQLISS